MFSFGIITDTHIRAPQGDISSPYRVNDLANDRARYAVELLKNQSPDFVIHLGDMVHPLPEMEVYTAACAEARDIFEPLGKNLHYVPGNHDVGDKPVASGPASIVTESGLNKYETQFGPSWKYFNHQNCCIIILNSSLVNSTLQEAAQQHAWLETVFIENKGQRFIVFSHYPVFIHDVDEPEHYDNIALPGRRQLLDLFKIHSVELVFSGHVHHFFYNDENECAYYVLPPTSFTRQDYAELFGVGPALEFGRDDVGKYSVAMVHILENGHELQLIPTFGKSAKRNEPKRNLPKGKHERTLKKDIVVSLRHAWHESKYLPYNGPMEEFSRKLARNDYGLLRLLQMGIRDVRIPLQDLTSQASLDRIKDYHALGIRFHVFCLAEHWQTATQLIDGSGAAIASLEYVLSGKATSWSLEGSMTPDTIPVSLSYAASGAHQANATKPFAHSVSTGFTWSDREEVFAAVDNATISTQIDRLLFQISWEADLSSTIAHMSQEFDSLPWGCAIYLRLASSNPAMANFDDEKIAERIHKAMTLLENKNKLHLYVDTFMDIDRGYSPRHGFIDRLGNLRKVGSELLTNRPTYPQQ